MMAGGRAEVDLGKLAQQKSRNTQVRDFAAMMVRDHTKAAEELKTVATRANIDMAQIDPDAGDNKDVHDRLAKLSGMEFDREYMQMMVDKHEKTVNELEDKAEGADNDHVKQWAARTLPTVKKHLEQARAIHETLDKKPRT
jgi:putative membrane protein